MQTQDSTTERERNETVGAREWFAYHDGRSGRDGAPDPLCPDCERERWCCRCRPAIAADPGDGDPGPPGAEMLVEIETPEGYVVPVPARPTWPLWSQVVIR